MGSDNSPVVVENLAQAHSYHPNAPYHWPFISCRL